MPGPPNADRTDPIPKTDNNRRRRCHSNWPEGQFCGWSREQPLCERKRILHSGETFRCAGRCGELTCSGAAPGTAETRCMWDISQHEACHLLGWLRPTSLNIRTKPVGLIVSTSTRPNDERDGANHCKADQAPPPGFVHIMQTPYGHCDSGNEHDQAG